MNNEFTIHSAMTPQGDQPNAIKALTAHSNSARTLLGVTGSGKTFTIAHVIEKVKKPTLIISPNKTLAAQLYEEFCSFFPKNKVCFFVSYYDYYQPESYLPAENIYIPKEAKINIEIDRMRTETLASLVSRDDVIVVSSISCIYALGNPKDYKECAMTFFIGMAITKEAMVQALFSLDFIRSAQKEALLHGQFFETMHEIFLATSYQREIVVITFLAECITSIVLMKREYLTRNNDDTYGSAIDSFVCFPAKYFISTMEKRERAIKSITAELNAHLPTIQNPLYHDRLYARVTRDIFLIKETGTCPGIENYSAHFENRAKGHPPFTLFDFFAEKEFMTVIDESHLATAQMMGMYEGDRARKKSLIDYGFRLPSAYDNRPLTFHETEKFLRDVIFVSATPGEYELKKSVAVIEQVLRPTNIVDPLITIHPRAAQLDQLEKHLNEVRAEGGRTLITVLTTKLAENLADFLENRGIRACYLHHKIKTQIRTEILHKLREGVFECLIGINLLREGLDLPEVSLVIIMDADIQGFLRDKRSLIQTIGRAARNNNARVLFFADTITKSMKEAIDETERRRNKQLAHNKKYNLVAQSTQRTYKKSIIPLAPKAE